MAMSEKMLIDLQERLHQRLAAIYSIHSRSALAATIEDGEIKKYMVEALVEYQSALLKLQSTGGYRGNYND